MNLQQLIADRRTIHDYRVESLPEGAVERALSAALAAPNHRMTEPWRFVRVGPDARARLVEISADLKSGGAGLSGPALEKLRAKMLSPAELIVVCQVRSEDPALAREDYAATACAIQNAMLAWWAEGIGSKWSTGAVTTDIRTYQTLGVEPAQEEIIGFVWAGYAAREAAKPRRRRALADVLRTVP